MLQQSVTETQLTSIRVNEYSFDRTYQSVLWHIFQRASKKTDDMIIDGADPTMNDEFIGVEKFCWRVFNQPVASTTLRCHGLTSRGIKFNNDCQIVMRRMADDWLNAHEKLGKKRAGVIAHRTHWCAFADKQEALGAHALIGTLGLNPTFGII